MTLTARRALRKAAIRFREKLLSIFCASKRTNLPAPAAKVWPFCFNETLRHRADDDVDWRECGSPVARCEERGRRNCKSFRGGIVAAARREQLQFACWH